MSEHLKHFFIPHEGNNYHPHILHTKRAVFYSAFFLGLKAMVFLFAMLIPSVVFVMPDVLAGEENKLLTLTNNLRIQKGLSTLSPMVPLHVSSDLKATDMADLHYFSHTSPNGYGLAHFLSVAGYNYDAAGENLAMGFSSAEEIFSSWVKSPTHYANLIDPDFKEFGVSMESGLYNDLATVYVAQHFGSPKVVTPKPFPESLEKTTLETAVVAPTAQPKKSVVPPVKKPVVVTPVAPQTAPPPVPVAKAPVTPEATVALVPAPTPKLVPVFHAEPVPVQAHFISEASSAQWKEVGDQTFLSADAQITGDVQSAVVSIGSYSFPLSKNTDDGLYHGGLLVSEPVNNFFKPIVEPSLQIVGVDGQHINSVLIWKQIKVVSPSPLEKYTRAKSLPGIPEHIFTFSNGVYLFFIVFFSIALILSIVIEIRRQHHHIIAQTVGLLVLLATLIMS